MGELAELGRRGLDLRILSLLPPREELQHSLLRRAGLHQLVTYKPDHFLPVLREFQPQILHAHFATESTQVARELAGSVKAPFTFTAHGYDIFRKPPPDFADRAAAAAAVVTVCEANADYIHRTFGVRREHVHVIGCGVDTERFRPPAGRAPSPSGRGLGEGDCCSGSRSFTASPLVLCVARHVAVKNLAVLLHACALLRDRGVSFRCVLVGDGPCRAELEALRAHLDLLDCVQMPGAAEQDQVLNWCQQADIGVLTSDNEGLPVSLMEAAACGVPVVATSVGGVPELVEHGVTGLLSNRGEPQGVADALEKLIGEPELRARMGAAARARAVQKFSVSRQADQLLGLWSRIVNNAA